MLAHEPGLTVTTQQQDNPPPHSLDEVPTVGDALRLCWQRRAGVALALAPTVVILAFAFAIFGTADILLLLILKGACEPVALSYTLGTHEYRPTVAFTAWRRALRRLWVSLTALLVIGLAAGLVAIVPFIGWALSLVIEAGAFFAIPIIAFEDLDPLDVLRRVGRFVGVVRQQPRMLAPLTGLLVLGFLLMAVYAFVFVLGGVYMVMYEDYAFAGWWLAFVLLIGPVVLTLWSTWTLAWMTLLYLAFRSVDERATLAPAWAA